MCLSRLLELFPNHVCNQFGPHRTDPGKLKESQTLSLKTRPRIVSDKKKEHKDEVFGSGDRPVGWGVFHAKGWWPKSSLPSLESLSSLGFDDRCVPPCAAKTCAVRPRFCAAGREAGGSRSKNLLEVP